MGGPRLPVAPARAIDGKGIVMMVDVMMMDVICLKKSKPRKQSNIYRYFPSEKRHCPDRMFDSFTKKRRLSIGPRCRLLPVRARGTDLRFHMRKCRFRRSVISKAREPSK
jgi:hypothetical protein